MLLLKINFFKIKKYYFNTLKINIPLPLGLGLDQVKNLAATACLSPLS
jgi:hypothetical protein